MDLSRDEILGVLDRFYAASGRTTYPQYRTYTLHELRKCLALFKLKPVRAKD